MSYTGDAANRPDILEPFGPLSAMRLNGTPDRQRSSSLDGVRGLVALSVVTLHLLSVFVDTNFARYAWFAQAFRTVSYTPLSAFWAGSSVIVFFVLSGYALHRMLSADHMTYRSYAVRRIIRLWVPYAVALALAALSIMLIGSHKINQQSAWMNTFLGAILSPKMLAEHALMIGVFDTTPLDFVIWSLVIEMRVSLIFPIIFWMVDRLPPYRLLIASVLVGGVSIYLKSYQNALLAAIVSSLNYQTYFVIGALISRHEQRIRQWYSSLSRETKWVALSAAAVLYCNCFRLSSTYSVMIGSSWLMIVALCSGRARALLMRPAVQWLGKISYSLYICHAIVLLSLINLLYPRLSFLSIVLICIPTVFLVSFLLYRLVEVPSISLSRLAGRRLQPNASGELIDIGRRLT